MEGRLEWGFSYSPLSIRRHSRGVVDGVLARQEAGNEIVGKAFIGYNSEYLL